MTFALIRSCKQTADDILVRHCYLLLFIHFVITKINIKEIKQKKRRGDKNIIVIHRKREKKKKQKTRKPFNITNKQVIYL